ncbi:MAG: cytidine deaminase [Sphingomonadales bacterium]|nr:MAG: cytidine deaminase [Sphingomonadales bacterium]TNF06154.1 MAG: cytidine deaminase [Sphingomonadales bacterium]
MTNVPQNPREEACDEMLVSAAREAMNHAYAPYSRFAVGAAARLSDGSIVTGANFENISYGLSLCAETVAIASVNAAGALADIVAMAVIGGAVGKEGNDGNEPITPCGRCRQIMAEAARVAGRDFPVYCAASDGPARALYRVSDLLPHAFSAAGLARGDSM